MCIVVCLQSPPHVCTCMQLHTRLHAGTRVRGALCASTQTRNIPK